VDCPYSSLAARVRHASFSFEPLNASLSQRLTGYGRKIPSRNRWVIELGWRRRKSSSIEAEKPFDVLAEGLISEKKSGRQDGYSSFIS
jgi:hypothetical protein